MKKINPLKFVLPILGLSSVAALVGSISGTIAWYAYTTRALVSYSGTSVQSTTQLQIGIKSDVVVSFPSTVSDLITDVTFEDDTFVDENQQTQRYHYYFMKAGAGGMPAAAINAYLSQKGFTTNILEPLSSYEYHTGENLNLRNRPSTNKIDDVFAPAEISKYVEIPFVFRVLSNNSAANPTYVGGHDIFLSGAEAKALAVNEKINESIRLYVDRTNGDNYILNPSSASDGTNKVCGVLDLSNDGYFDYDNNLNSLTYGKELLYGEYSLEEGYDLDDCLSEPLSDTSALVDINNTSNTSEQTTFTSRHYKGIEYFNTLENNHIVPKYAQYLGKDTVFPTKVNGELTSQYAVCQTSTTGHNLGTFNMKVYIEGWDHSVIDKELTHQFYLGLTFEINIVKDNNTSSANSSSSSEVNNG